MSLKDGRAEHTIFKQYLPFLGTHKTYRVACWLVGKDIPVVLYYCRGCCTSVTENDSQRCLGECGSYWHPQCLSKEISRIEKRAIITSFPILDFRTVALKQSLCPKCAKKRKCDACEAPTEAHLIQCYTCNRTFHEKCLIQPCCNEWAETWQCTTCKSTGAALRTADPFTVPDGYFQNKSKNNKSQKNNYPSIIEFGKWEICTLYTSEHSLEFKIPKLYVCEFCLTFRKTKETMNSHYYNCRSPWPPGDEIYRHNTFSVFEVDGSISKKYCIDLCLLAKFWLYEKNMYLEVEAFFFYVLTNKDEYGYHLLGYFSKEKCWNENNLACILVLPPYQSYGYGRYLIEFSYLLSRKEGKPGKPERPLSELGQKVYLAYWTSSILEYFFNHRSASTVTIENISKETGLDAEDIINTLVVLNMIRKGKPHETVPVIVVNWSLVESYMIKKKSKLKILPENLLWKPHQITHKPRADDKVKEFEITFLDKRAPAPEK